MWGTAHVDGGYVQVWNRFEHAIAPAKRGKNWVIRNVNCNFEWNSDSLYEEMCF